MAGRPKKGEELTIDMIVEASWKIVEKMGIGSLSTRNLAAELNVKSPALYWHIKNKDHLLSLMVEHIVDEIAHNVPDDLHWWDWLVEVGRFQRKNLLSRRDSGVILSSALPSERLRHEVFPNSIRPLQDAGFSRSDAAKVYAGIVYCVIGAVIYEQREQTIAFARDYNDPEDTFNFILTSYVEGVKQAYPHLM